MNLILCLSGGMLILGGIYLLRIVWLWGYTQGERDEYARQTDRKEIRDQDHPQSEWQQECENDDKANSQQ